MSLERVFMLVIGLVVLIGALLAHLHHPYWLYLLMVVGFMVAQAGVTGFCPSKMILKSLGFKNKPIGGPDV